MGFIRRQEESLALRYLLWQYQKKQIHRPVKSLMMRIV
jgi:hypothetical protein